MDPNQIPQAPPPMQPVTPSNNPYEFITQGPPAGKTSRIPGSSKKKRILVVMSGLLVLSIVAAVVIGILNSGAKGPTEDYRNLLSQQTELIRVSGIGTTKAQQAEAKNLAITTNFSLVSQQADLLNLAKKAGVKTDAKSLPNGKNSQTDTSLDNASQNNQFDSEFVKIMRTSLKKYQETVKKIYDETPSKSAKETLAKSYANASILIGEQKQ